PPGRKSRLGCATDVCSCPGSERSSITRARATARRSRLHLLHGVACALCLRRRDCCCLPDQFSSVGPELWPTKPHLERAFRPEREGGRFFRSLCFPSSYI